MRDTPEKRGLRATALRLLEPESRILDIGPGDCVALEALVCAGHSVLGIGLDVESYVDPKTAHEYGIIDADYNEFDLGQPFDAIWASHVLEHQLNANHFIRKMHHDLREGGWLFCIVPPMKTDIVGGHVNVYNEGLLLYNLIVGGFDCSKAMVNRIGYNIAVFVQKRTYRFPRLRRDEGDIEKLADYFPIPVRQAFAGSGIRVNWKG